MWNRRHAPPRRWCGCGFYCLHDLADARSLACATENRSALTLEVTASGRYIRYERGLRYSRQRVRAILDAQCACGRPGTALADAGSGLIGWRHLAPVCDSCTAGRPALALREFAARLNGGVRVATLLSSTPLALGVQQKPATRELPAGGRTADRGPCRGDSAVARPPGRPTVSARQVTAISHSRGRSPPYHLTVT